MQIFKLQSFNIAMHIFVVLSLGSTRTAPRIPSSYDSSLDSTNRPYKYRILPHRPNTYRTKGHGHQFTTSLSVANGAHVSCSESCKTKLSRGCLGICKVSCQTNYIRCCFCWQVRCSEDKVAAIQLFISNAPKGNGIGAKGS